MPYDLSGRALHPLVDLVDLEDFPLSDFLPAEALQTTFDSLYYTESECFHDGDNLVIDLHMAFESDLSFGIPGSDSFALVLGSGGEGWTVLKVRIVIGPDFSLSFYETTLALRVSKNILSDVATGASSEIEIKGDIVFSNEGIAITNFSGATLRPAFVCGTEIIVEAQDVRPVFGLLDPPPFMSELEEFHGVAFEKLSVAIPPKYLTKNDGESLTIEMLQASIGTTGFTGQVVLEATDDPITGNFLGFPFKFYRFHLDINQNSLIEAQLQLDVRLEKFEDSAEEKWVRLDIAFSNNGNFSAALSAAQPGDAAVIQLRYEGILRLKVNSLRITHDQENIYALYFSGGMKILIDGAVEWPELEFSEIGINSRGDFLLPDGAGVTFASPLVVPWHFVRLTITKFRFGYSPNNRNRLQIALCGEVMLIDGISAGASVEGLVIEWEPKRANSRTIKFDGIGVTVGIPGSFNAALEVSYIENDGVTEFRGQGKLEMTSLDVSIDIAIVVGQKEGYTFLYLFADAKILPTGIPIGSTGLAIYGFQGLIAYNMALAVDEALPFDERFYVLFVKDPIGITDPDKWAAKRGSNALGIGVVLGTIDKGFSLNVKGMLVVTFPSLTILLQAKANLLKVKPDMSTDAEGSLEALMTYSAGSTSLTIDILARYTIPHLVKVEGAARAYFNFNDSSAWYVQIGKDENGKRVSADVFELNNNWLFNAGFWFTLNERSVITGARIALDLRAERAGFWVEASGTARGQMGLFWEPNQWEGSLAMSGRVGAGYRGVSVSIGLSGNAQARAFEPFDVHVHVEACVEALLWEVCKSFNFDWAQNDPPQVKDPIRKWSATPMHWTPRKIGTQNKLDMGVKELRIGEVTENVQPHSVISLDFSKSMVDTTGKLNEAIDLDNGGFLTIGKDSDWSAQYELLGISIIEISGGEERELDVWGTWAKETLEPNTTLRLFSSERFGHDGSLTNGFVEEANIDYCDEPKDNKRCVTLDDLKPGYGRLSDGSLYYWENDIPEPGAEDKTKSPSDKVTIIPPRKVEEVEVTVTKDSDDSSNSKCKSKFWRLLCSCLVIFLVLALFLVMYLIYIGTGTFKSAPSLYLLLALLLICPIVILVLGAACRKKTSETTSTGPPQAEEGIPDEGSGDDYPIDVPTENPTRSTSTAPVNPNPNGEIVVSWGKGERPTKFCYLQGHGTSDWKEVTQRGGTATTNEAWTVPLELRVLPVRMPLELNVSYRVNLKSPSGNVTTPIERVLNARFTIDDPPIYNGALINYIGSVYPFDGARPVFTGYDMAVKFLDSYVPFLYTNAGSPLFLKLCDGQGHSVLDADGNPVLLPLLRESSPVVTIAQRAWMDIFERNVETGCASPKEQPATVPNELGLVTADLVAPLTPNSQYTAHLISDANDRISLYQWGFTTSRFSRFRDLVTNGRSVLVPFPVAMHSVATGFDNYASESGIPLIAYVDVFTVSPLLNTGSDLCSALLFESPEPLDFNKRLSVSVNGIDATLLGNLDGTRGFVIPAAPLALTNLTIRLTWLLIPTGVAVLPALKVRGASDPEVIEFSIDLTPQL